MDGKDGTRQGQKRSPAWSRARAKRELTAWARSGGSMAEYARIHGLPVKRLWSWHQRLRKLRWTPSFGQRQGRSKRDLRLTNKVHVPPLSGPVKSRCPLAAGCRKCRKPVGFSKFLSASRGLVARKVTSDSIPGHSILMLPPPRKTSFGIR